MSSNPQDIAAQDDAHLRSLGIKPELQRSLGFLSNFAVAFSYISVSTGTFTVFALAIGFAGPIFFWAWPLVILGQTFVALNFAELASHFPVAGSIYQWSKRLSHRTLGWFTGWIYFWAGVLTVTAVAVTVPLVVAGINGTEGFLDSPDPTGITTMYAFVALVTLAITTAINAFGVRLLSIINNIGVATEILGMLDLRPRSCSSSPTTRVRRSCFETRGLESAANGNVFAIFLIGAFIALFVVYGFDTAGTFGEETIDASRQAPRGILSAIWLSGIVGAIFLLAIILSFKDMDAAIAEGQAFGFPIATTLQDNLTAEIVGRNHIRGAVSVRDPGVGLRVHAGHPRRHDPTDVLDGARPPAPVRAPLGARQSDVPDAVVCRRGGRHPRRRPDRADRTARRGHPGDRGDRDDLPQLLPVQPGRAGRPPSWMAAAPGVLLPAATGAR